MWNRRAVVNSLGAAVPLAGLPARVFAETAKTPLWRATKGGEVISLFGAPHATPPAPLWRTRAFDEAFLGARTLFVETLNRKTFGATWTALGAMRSRRGQRPVDLLEDEPKRVFVSLARSYGLDRSTFWSLKPVFAARYIQSGQLQRAGHAALFSPFGELTAMDARRQLPTRLQELESGLAPTLILAEADFAAQMRDLEYVLSDPTQVPQRAADLHRAWIGGDFAAMAPLCQREVDTFMALGVSQAMMQGRQCAWLEKITVAAKDGPVAVLVGLTHLVAEEGLVRELEALGYSVQLVNV